MEIEARRTVESASPSPPPPNRRFTWSDFFNFRYLVTPAVIKVVYLMGVVVIVVGSVGYVSPAILGGGDVGASLLFLVVGNLSWRVLMEVAMVLFGIHEAVRAIEQKPR